MKKIAIFASGSGSNAENIANYFEGKNLVEISLILTNNPSAFVIERAKKMEIPCFVFSKTDFAETDFVLNELLKAGVDWIVLAGFLLKVPQNLLTAFEGRIVNIHPALLPKFGGKGMYGDRVHQAVVDSGETESGITVHYVNEHYDEGAIIFQAKCTVAPEDTADEVAAKVHALEYEYFPKAIEQLIK